MVQSIELKGGSTFGLPPSRAVQASAGSPFLSSLGIAQAAEASQRFYRRHWASAPLESMKNVYTTDLRKNSKAATSFCLNPSGRFPSIFLNELQGFRLGFLQIGSWQHWWEHQRSLVHVLPRLPTKLKDSLSAVARPLIWNPIPVEDT